MILKSAAEPIWSTSAILADYQACHCGLYVS
jgi:ferredoxin-thioredoxin reductase catalytic subunit